MKSEWNSNYGRLTRASRRLARNCRDTVTHLLKTFKPDRDLSTTEPPQRLPAAGGNRNSRSTDELMEHYRRLASEHINKTILAQTPYFPYRARFVAGGLDGNPKVVWTDCKGEQLTTHYMSTWDRYLFLTGLFTVLGESLKESPVELGMLILASFK